jgi:hypothetical protein
VINQFTYSKAVGVTAVAQSVCGTCTISSSRSSSIYASSHYTHHLITCERVAVPRPLRGILDKQLADVLRG